MSLLSKVSVMAANIMPKDVGFLGISGDVFWQNLSDLGAHFLNWFYGIVRWFLAFVDFLQYAHSLYTRLMCSFTIYFSQKLRFRGNKQNIFI